MAVIVIVSNIYQGFAMYMVIYKVLYRYSLITLTKAPQERLIYTLQMKELRNNSAKYMPRP